LQSKEFTIRAQVVPPTDLIVVDGNPLKKLELLQEQGKHLSAIMKGGRFHKNALH
jgi:hypothetical protein